MLDKEVFFSSMDKLSMSYPNWKLDTSNKDTMRFWYSKFNDLTNEQFAHMVDKYIDNESFGPSIASLRKWDILPRKSKDQIKHEQMLREIGWYDD